MPAARRVPAPHLLAAAFAAGLAAALGVGSPSAAPVLAAAAACLGAIAGERRRALFLTVALLLAGWWWGSLRLEALDASRLTAAVGEAGPARLVVTGPARASRFAVRLPVRVESFRAQTVDERAQLELPPGRSPPQGAIVEAIVEIREPRDAAAPGEFDERGYLRRQGAHVVLRAAAVRVVGRRDGLGGLADRIRGWLVSSLAPGVEDERRSLIAAVVLGEDERLDPALRDDFRASGLYHLLAVSGQNVAYVVAGALLFAWAVGLPRWAGQAGALAGIAAYVLAVGWQPSVVRAGVAGMLASLAWLASRATDRWYFLLVGASVLLAWNPYSLLEPGFQLSFGAVAAIFVLVPRLERRLEGYPVPRRLAEVCAVSAGCGAATAPILMAHFGAVPLYTVPANAAAAPVMAPLLGLALVSAALGVVLPTAAAGLAWLDGWLAAYLAACARFFGGLPHAQLTSWSALFALTAACVLLAVLVRLRPPRGRRALVLVAVAALAAGGWSMRPRALPPPPTGLRVSFLDVGQGDATLVQVPEGALLVDEGPPEADVAGQLERLGVGRLAAIVLTHPQRDHVGGAADVLRRLRVGFVLDPRIPAASADETAALAAARARGVRVVAARAGQTFRLGRLVVRVLWPDGPGARGDDPNNHAVVLLASYGEVDVLLTADAEGDVTVPLDVPEAEVMKVAHHGSEDPYLAELLDDVRPRVAVVSVGAQNDYGHPTASTLATLESDGVAVYRTDEEGRVTVESDGSRLVVRTEH